MAGTGTREMTQAILWAAAFIIPSFSLGMPVPHAPYVLIPALAVAVGFVDRHALRRVMIWLGLILLYELVYHIPVGMFAVPVAAMVVFHRASARIFRMEPTSVSGHASFPAFFRVLWGASVWVLGLIVLSALWGAVVGTMPSVSFASLYTVWWYHGVLLNTVLGVSVVLVILYLERSRRVRVVFSDDAIIQTQNISD